jgi:hypothetical protein
VDGRISLYQDSLASIARDPFGIGWGSFQGITFGGHRYPHNLPLEVLAEAGVVLGGLFLLWLALRIIRAHAITFDYLRAAVFATVVFAFGKALVSGDINDNRVAFYALGLAIAAGAVSTRLGDGARGRGEGSASTANPAARDESVHRLPDPLPR